MSMTDPYAEISVGEDVREEKHFVSRSFDEKPQGGHPRFQGGDRGGDRQQRRQRGPPQIGHEVVTLSEKMILPVKEFPRYNFVGKLLGPKGANLKEMQAFCKVRMSIMGRGSTKDRSKEEELSQTDDEKYAHLKEPLHVIISVKAPRIEAHRRLGSAFRELNKFMGPVNEEMSQAPHQAPQIADIAMGRAGEAAAALPPQPKICFGVPPPGAIILNEQPTIGQTQARLTRGDECGVMSNSRDSYAYEVAYGGAERSSGRRGDKRQQSYNGMPVKRYKQEDHYTTR